MKCTICNKPVVLVPSASERASRYGGKASDYTKKFNTHSACFLEKRKQDTIDLMRKIVAENKKKRVIVTICKNQ